MSWSLVHETTNKGSGAASYNTTVTAPTYGNLVTLAVNSADDGASFGNPDNQQVSSVTLAGVTWTRRELVNFAFQGFRATELWQGVVGQGAGTTLTVAFSNANSNTTVYCLDYVEWSGVAASPFDVGTTSTVASGTALTVGPITTTGNGDLVVTAIRMATGVTSPTRGVPLQTGLSQAGTNAGAQLSDLYELVSGPITVSYTWSGAALDAYGGCIASFFAPVLPVGPIYGSA